MPKSGNIAFISDSMKSLEKEFSGREKKIFKSIDLKDCKYYSVPDSEGIRFFCLLDKKDDKSLDNEMARSASLRLLSELNQLKAKEISIIDAGAGREKTIAFLEGMILGNYQFLKYFQDKDKKESKLKQLNIISHKISKNDISELLYVSEAVYYSRTLVNEPVSYLNSEKLASEIKKLGKEAGFKVTVFNKKKIEQLKMGGLLAVNKGSIDPPTFTIMEWNPAKARNKKPLVLVGKGVVFDTGGLSLKPTAGSMDEMKCDMAGAAAVIGALYAASKNKLPLHIIGLIPATDNRPDGNAYAPGDVIKMYNKMTVEVLNTDAEGRMILADALSYADKYKPELIMDVATLTGAAAAAIGPNGVVAMGNADEKYMKALKKSGNNVFERIAELPFWDDYSELMKSDIADMKNIGGKVAGAITAGKFLEKFTSFPYIHIDIAGPAFINKNDAYRTKGSTGVGIRLLYDFMKNYSK